MAGEVQELVATSLGGNFGALRVMLDEASTGFASGDEAVRGDGSGLVAGVGRWGTATGMDKAALVELRRYLSEEFIPALDKGIQGAVYTPSFDPAIGRGAILAG